MQCSAQSCKSECSGSSHVGKKSVPCHNYKYCTQSIVVAKIEQMISWLNIKKCENIMNYWNRLKESLHLKVKGYITLPVHCCLVTLSILPPPPFFLLPWPSPGYSTYLFPQQCCSGKLKWTTVATTLEQAVLFLATVHTYIDSMRTFTVSELQTLIWWLILVNSPCHVTASRD